MVGLVFGNGIDLWYSTNNTVRNNIIANCTAAGIDLDTSTDNILFGNSIEKNGARIQVYSSSNNTFYHNNFLNFHETEPDNFGSNNNTWSTNSQGNYWSDYAGLDDGSNNRTASDGIGDTDLPWHGVDDNPLISPFNPVRVFWDNMGFPVYLTSNSTISSFNFDQPNKQITFSTKQPANTTGYFNISIPKTLLDRSAEQNWTLLIDNSNIASNYIITETESYSTIYLSYAGNRTVQIVGGYVIPEYSNFTLLLVMTLSTVLSLIILVKNKALPEPIRQSEEII
jgi:parallel beta-helix repeat protein